MPATTTTLTTLIKPVPYDQMVMIKWSNKELFPILVAIGMREVQSQGGANFEWRINRATGNSGTEIFTEGQAVPAAGSQTYSNPALAYIYHRSIVEISGHAMDQMRSHYISDAQVGSANLYGEVTGAMDDLEDLYTNTFLGSTNNGLQIAIDSTGTYAGLARGTITDFASFETAGGAAALTIAMMRDTWEGVRDNDRGGNVQAIIMPWNQTSNYTFLAQGTTTGNFVRHLNEPGKGPSIDLGVNFAGLSFNGVPIYGLSDLTDTEILMLSNISTDWLYAIQRPLSRKHLAINDDAEARLQLSLASSIVCLNPRRQGKVSDVAA